MCCRGTCAGVLESVPRIMSMAGKPRKTSRAATVAKAVSKAVSMSRLCSAYCMLRLCDIGNQSGACKRYSCLQI